MRLLIHLGYLGILSAISIVLLGGYWLSYPYNILEITRPTVTDKVVYKAGDRIAYTVSYCKNKAHSAKVLRVLVNGTRLNFTEIFVNAELGCKTVKVEDLVIPDFVDAGIYHLEITAEFHPNPIRTILVVFKTNDFVIK